MIRDAIKAQIRKMGFVRSLELENQKLDMAIENLQNEIFNLSNELEQNNEILKSFSTIPDFENVKHSLIGKDGYLFLVNDSNNEIRQHYDKTYYNKFDINLLHKILNSRKDYCNQKNIPYYFFIVPDKSYVCRDLLPFNVKFIKRNYDHIKDLVPDFSDKLDPSCYWRTDTHINFIGGNRLTYLMLNHIDNNFKREQYERLINKQMDINDQYTIQPRCDLLFNWSYSNEEFEKYKGEKQVYYSNKYSLNLNHTIPAPFRFNSKRKTYYSYNRKSATKLKILVFRDSSAEFFRNTFSVYPRELLCYWDHWCFNKDLIEWFQPDIILEVRTERLLDNMKGEIEKRKKLIDNESINNLILK
ncbi:MAG: hypothetical protein WCF28_10985 [Methanobacterium sp.]|uniref:hypothetical protein n=1 Tax=Methanobacterium sp. TaxID=2164 RepID=UPI003C72C711